MTCQWASALIEPYLDGELDAARKADLEQHFAECADCEAARQRLAGLTSRLRADELRYDAPEHLRTRVLKSVRQASGARQAGTPWIRSWAIAATVLLAVSSGWNLLHLRSSGESDVAREIVSDHVRSLMGDHLLDIQSTDQHNVKPWFNGRLDYAPDVRDYAGAGFPLVGGRVDYLDRRPVAALIYKRHQHTINVFEWPAATAVAAPESDNGFNMICWNRQEMNYCAVSDLNGAELRQFTDLYR